MKKTELLLIYGGESAEHEVSVGSAKYIFSLIDQDRFNINLCYIDRSGRWWQTDEVSMTPSCDVELSPCLGTGKLIGVSHEIAIEPDVIFPVTLGPNGEDGTIQAVAKLLHIPVVGSDITGSAICMDKDITKRLLVQAGIPTAKYIVHHIDDPDLDFSNVSKSLGSPVFIKPANLGSSVGVTKASNESDFAAGMQLAHKYDNKVLIEEAVSGSEVGCGIIGNEQPRSSVVSQIDIGRESFFTYDAKYKSNSSAVITIPGNFPEDVIQEIKNTALKAYKVLECRGFARVDLFLTNDNKVLVNEINTLPASRDDSSFPKLWKASGIKPTELFNKIIDYALEHKF